MKSEISFVQVGAEKAVSGLESTTQYVIKPNRVEVPHLKARLSKTQRH